MRLSILPGSCKNCLFDHGNHIIANLHFTVTGNDHRLRECGIGIRIDTIQSSGDGNHALGISHGVFTVLFNNIIFLIKDNIGTVIFVDNIVKSIILVDLLLVDCCQILDILIFR